MINLLPIIARIEALLEAEDAHGLTYAALEARLALEAVCYDRLRVRHAYISQAQLKKWQPAAVVNQLMEEVDPHVAETYTLSISRNPMSESGDPDEQEYLEVGTAIGFEPKKIKSLWNALSNLALHVRVPENSKDMIRIYGNQSNIRDKVLEAVEELKRLSKSTLDSKGFGVETSFNCSCGTLNKRRSDFLVVGQAVCCLNPDCMYDWIVEKISETECNFVCNSIELNCESCGGNILLPKRALAKMTFNQQMSCSCSHCGQKNFWGFGLQQRRVV
jgi:hypothetical protein